MTVYLLQTFACRERNALPGRTSGPATSFFVAVVARRRAVFHNRFQGLMIRLYINRFSINVRMELLAPMNQDRQSWATVRFQCCGIMHRICSLCLFGSTGDIRYQGASDMAMPLKQSPGIVKQL